MLPSAGYFKEISCPFFENGFCGRPYCHYRHVKKDSQNTSNDDIESGAIWQKLVSAAVQKVLQQTETTSTNSMAQPAEDNAEDDSMANNVQSVSKATYNPTPISHLNKINKTESVEEIDGQRRKHIPVPYTPRKPAGVATKRSIETNGSCKSFVFVPPPLKYTPGSSDTVMLDPYMPEGSQEFSEMYLPGSETELQQYTPSDTQPSIKRKYVPSDKKYNKKKLLEYKPVKVSSKSETSSVTYQPTLRSLAPFFSSDEDEPETNIRLMSTDLNGLDDLGPEFDILDQILDDERNEHNMKLPHENNKDIKNKNTKFEPTTEKDKVNSEENIKKIEQSKKEKHTSAKKDSIKSQIDKIKCDKPDFDTVKQILDKEKPVHDTVNKNTKTEEECSKEKERESSKENKKTYNDQKIKHICDKKENNKSLDKTKVNKKDNSSLDNKYENKSKSSDKKRHKNSSKDKVKEEKQEKPIDKKKHSISKSSYRSSRSSDRKSSSSRDMDKHSKHSNHSKYDSNKRKDKSHKSVEQSKDKLRKCKNEKCYDLSDNDSIHNADNEVLKENNEDSYEMSDPDEEMIALECKRIFEEYVPQEKTTKNTEDIDNTLLDNTSEIEYIPGKKRVSRTMGKNIKVMPKEKIKPNFKVNAAQMMAERSTKIKEYHASKTVSDTLNNDSISPKPDTSRNISSTPNAGNKIRIAHVPNASTLMSAKKAFSPNPIVNKEQPSTSSTVIQTIKKGVQRVAHMPNEKFIDRPGVLEPLASKIAANIRSTYLNMMIDECIKIYLSPTDAYARAQYEELATSKKCCTMQVYRKSAVLTVTRLRKELQECNGRKKAGLDAALQKIPQTVSGKTDHAGSWSIESKYRQVSDNSREFTGARFYLNISKWVLTEEQLQDNGFPRPHISGERGKATISIQNKNKPPKGVLRTCCRCKKDYTIDKKGFPAVKEECIYHPNNKYRVRGEPRYQCCSQDATSDGCCIAPCHVYEYVDFENLRGYVRTLPSETEMEDYGVYSLDCEMCYTTHGLDLTRVTVIDSACKVVYETLVKPFHPIIDYNTRYSGITEEQMAGVTTTLLEVQATLLTMFNSKTILIGHSLESDFKALKFIHDTVIDTSVLYPHKMGPPYKRALRNLCSDYLKKIIQNSVDGHDSTEDATVCMELVLYKLREDLKTR